MFVDARDNAERRERVALVRIAPQRFCGLGLGGIERTRARFAVRTDRYLRIDEGESAVACRAVRRLCDEGAIVTGRVVEVTGTLARRQVARKGKVAVDERGEGATTGTLAEAAMIAAPSPSAANAPMKRA